ncbi:MAG: RimK/LysX family protein [Planctomycetaceae bacterium]
MNAKHRKTPTQIVGWREWVALPDLGIPRIKAKVDTGARSSCLHAFHVKKFTRDGKTFVRFKVHPVQRRSTDTVEAEAEVFEFRSIRSSNGQSAVRPVILTHVELLGQIWPVELTLANRDEMGFRMLLGRECVRKRFLVDAGQSYYGGNIERTRTKGRKKQ